MEDHPLLAVLEFLFRIFAAVHIFRPSPPLHYLMTHRAVVTMEPYTSIESNDLYAAVLCVVTISLLTEINKSWAEGHNTGHNVVLSTNAAL
jgi:hypothetical protein